MATVTLGFTPAPPGWVAVFADDNGSWEEPVAGWIHEDNDDPRDTSGPLFVAAVHEDGYLWPVALHSQFRRVRWAGP